MPKTVWTPRDELVCGKLDRAYEIAIRFESIELLDLLADIRHDCERMEQKLISRKEEVARLQAPANIQQQLEPDSARRRRRLSKCWMDCLTTARQSVSG